MSFDMPVMPKDQWTNIASYLDPIKDKKNLELTCREFFELIRSPECRKKLIDCQAKKLDINPKISEGLIEISEKMKCKKNDIETLISALKIVDLLKDTSEKIVYNPKNGTPNGSIIWYDKSSMCSLDMAIHCSSGALEFIGTEKTMQETLPFKFKYGIKHYYAIVTEFQYKNLKADITEKNFIEITDKNEIEYTTKIIEMWNKNNKCS